MKKILLAIALMLALTSSAYALKQVAGTIEIDSCPGKMGHGLYGLIPDISTVQEVILGAEGDIKDYLYFPEKAVLQPGMVNYVVVLDRFENINPENDLYGKNITGFIYAKEKAQTCSGCAALTVELKKPIIINVCKKNFKFFDFFKKIFGK
jgi:hypothetical protein